MERMELIEATIKEAAKSFSRSLINFCPAVGKNGFNERNITYRLAHTFCKQATQHAFMEVPFFKEGKKRVDNHFDAVLFDKKNCIFIESKRLYSSEKNLAILRDIERFQHQQYVPYVLNNMVEDDNKPTSIWGLIVAEVWKRFRSRDVVGWWKDLNNPVKSEKADYPLDWIYDTILIKQYPNGSELHWVYCYGDLTNRKENGLSKKNSRNVRDGVNFR
jgi:hypothetical protein